MKTPKPPDHLTADSKAVWKTVFRDYQIDGAAEMILVAVLEARDRREEARLALATEGAVTKDRWGQLKVSPWASVERDAAVTMMRGWRLLGFDQEPRGELGRPGKH